MKTEKKESIGTRKIYLQRKVCLRCNAAQSIRRENCFKKTCRGNLRYRKG